MRSLPANAGSATPFWAAGSNPGQIDEVQPDYEKEAAATELAELVKAREEFAQLKKKIIKKQNKKEE